jgi:hypothetical protein
MAGHIMTGLIMHAVMLFYGDLFLPKKPDIFGQVSVQF